MLHAMSRLYGLIFDVDGVIADTEAANARASIKVFADFLGLEGVVRKDFEAGLGRGAEEYVKAGARVLVFEGGEALRFTPAAIEAGVFGSLRVLEALGMIQDAGVGEAPPTVEAKKTRWVRAGRSGILRGRVTLGDKVKKGQKLGVISDPLGQEAKAVVSRSEGIVIGRRINPLVHQGEAVVHIAEV